MILLKKQQTLILTPGKCGSTSLHDAFPRSIIGPQGPWKRWGLEFHDSIGKHTLVVPWEYQAWQQVVVVRDQASYLQSLWRHYQGHHEHIEWKAFTTRRLAWRAAGDRERWFYWYDMIDYLADVPESAKRVQLRGLDRFIKTLTGVQLNKRLNKSR